LWVFGGFGEVFIMSVQWSVFSGRCSVIRFWRQGDGETRRQGDLYLGGFGLILQKTVNSNQGSAISRKPTLYNTC